MWKMAAKWSRRSNKIQTNNKAKRRVVRRRKVVKERVERRWSGLRYVRFIWGLSKLTAQSKSKEYEIKKRNIDICTN